MPGVDWNDLRFLLAVHETGSVSAAARKLRVDQATVSRRLASLQKSVKARLVERTPQGMRLTSAGMVAVEAARQVADAAEALERRLDGADARLGGTVRVTAPETIATHVLAPHLPALAREHPQLRLELVVATQALNLSRREADVAVRMFRPREETLAARKLATLRFALYASRAYVAARGKPKLDDLRKHTVLSYDDSLAQTAEKQWLDRAADGAVVPFRSNSRASMLAAVRAGIGLTVLPCYLADPEPDLVRLCAPDEVPTREMWLVVHTDLQRTPRVRAAMDFVSGAFEAAKPRL